MNYDNLFLDGHRHYFFRVFGIITGVLAIIIGLYFKISRTEELFGIANRNLKFLLLLSLVNILFSRYKGEDERISAIQLQLFKLGFRLILILILIMEMGVMFNENRSIYGMFYYFVIGILGSVELIFEISKNSNYADIAEKNSAFHYFFMVVSTTLIVLCNMWLW
jgi:uncharacterized membrane protein